MITWKQVDNERWQLMVNKDIELARLYRRTIDGVWFLDTYINRETQLIGADLTTKEALARACVKLALLLSKLTTEMLDNQTLV
jgi:hypothetical protein